MQLYYELTVIPSLLNNFYLKSKFFIKLLLSEQTDAELNI